MPAGLRSGSCGLCGHGSISNEQTNGLHILLLSFENTNIIQFVSQRRMARRIPVISLLKRGQARRIPVISPLKRGQREESAGASDKRGFHIDQMVSVSKDMTDDSTAGLLVVTQNAAVSTGSHTDSASWSFAISPPSTISATPPAFPILVSSRTRHLVAAAAKTPSSAICVLRNT